MDNQGILRAGGACTGLVILLAFLAPGAAHAGFFDPFYASDFSPPDTIADWSVAAGNWRFANGEFVSSSSGALSIATVPTYDPRDIPLDTIGGELTLDVYFAIGSNAPTARVGAVFEFADVNNFHEVTFSATGQVVVQSRIAGVTRGFAVGQITAPGANKWVHLQLVRGSGHTSVIIDGVRIVAEVPQDGLQPGDIGLITRNTSARFDDLDARSFGRANDPYIEDFEDRVASHWQPLSGSWSVVPNLDDPSNEYANSAVVATAITQGPLGELYEAGLSPFDLAYTFKVRMVNPYGGSGNLVGVAWVIGPDDYTEVVFSPRGEARLNSVRNGVRSTLASAQYSGGGPDRWFEVEIEDDANLPEELAVTHIKVNGVTVFEMAPNLRDGEISLITHWAPGRFDDVRAAARFFRPFQEDFDDLFAPQIDRRAWRLADGMLTSSVVAKADRALVKEPWYWHDLADIELRVRMINRYGNSGNLVGFTYGERAQVYYEVVFSPTGVATLRRVAKGVPITIATASCEGCVEDQWFDAQLIQIGPRTTVKVNGVAVFQNVFQPDARGGRVGFVAHWTNASIDDVSFAQIPPTRYRVTALQNLANPFGPWSFVNALNDRGEAVGRSRSPNNSLTAVLWRGASVLDLQLDRGSEALGINNRSEIVGTSSQQGFSWKNGVRRDLGTSPDTTLPLSAALDINERGQIVGSSCNEQGCPALMWEPDGTIVLLEDIPGGIVWGNAYAINDSGEAVGESVNVDDGFAAASWQGGVVEPLATGRGSGATDINNRGQIVGFAQLLEQRAVTWREHEMFPLPLLPGLRQQSVARGLNGHGSIVGWQIPAASPFTAARAVLWQEGRVTDLNEVIACDGLPESIVLTRAEDINERGEIAVNGIDTAAASASDQRAYILTPVSARELCH